MSKQHCDWCGKSLRLEGVTSCFEETGVPCDAQVLAELPEEYLPSEATRKSEKEGKHGNQRSAR